MSLITCPECGKEISDQAEVCINCGYRLRSASSKKTGKNKALILVPIILLLLGIIASIVLYFAVYMPNQKYEEAVRLIGVEDYDKAIKMLEELGEYKDCNEKIQEANYKKAVSLYERESYEAALNVFKRAGDYSDSKKYIEIIENESLQANLKKELSEAYSKCYSSGTYLSSDGLSLFVDGEDENDTTSLADVYTVISELNLPDSLINEMGQTNALMGRQTENFDNYEVSWSYHPENGLDVCFKIKQ
ncbi:MAG: zinc-ribbon domain-containing protein [Lachnospiraceae bacterium]|nr:zinc-ribbon domain-containing protein [Lachnospiraceae bacterium]